MTDSQKKLLNKLGQTFKEIGEECLNDHQFHELMMDNNDLFPLSLDELAQEFFAIADEERISTLGKAHKLEGNKPKLNKTLVGAEETLQVINTFDIPEELQDLDPIETLWILKQVRESLEALVEDGRISSYDDAKVIEVVKIIHDNHESIDQEIYWRIIDELGLEE